MVMVSVGRESTLEDGSGASLLDDTLEGRASELGMRKDEAMEEMAPMEETAPLEEAAGAEEAGLSLEQPAASNMAGKVRRMIFFILIWLKHSRSKYTLLPRDNHAFSAICIKKKNLCPVSRG